MDFTLWDDASRDLEEEHAVRRTHAAKSRVGGTWSFLANAQDVSEYAQRKELAVTALADAVWAVTEDANEAEDTWRRLHASLDEDFKIILEARKITASDGHPRSYAYEADIHCPSCTEKRFGTDVHGDIPADAKDNEGNTVGAVAPWDEGDAHGEHCGTCGVQTDEPYNHHPDECGYEGCTGKVQDGKVMYHRPDKSNAHQDDAPDGEGDSNPFEGARTAGSRFDVRFDPACATCGRDDHHTGQHDFGPTPPEKTHAYVGDGIYCKDCGEGKSADRWGAVDESHRKDMSPISHEELTSKLPHGSTCDHCYKEITPERPHTEHECEYGEDCPDLDPTYGEGHIAVKVAYNDAEHAQAESESHNEDDAGNTYTPNSKRCETCGIGYTPSETYRDVHDALGHYTKTVEGSKAQKDCEKCKAEPGFHAGLHAGHIWTNKECPAYKSQDGDDCTCNSKTSGRYDTLRRGEGGHQYVTEGRGSGHCAYCGRPESDPDPKACKGDSDPTYRTEDGRQFAWTQKEGSYDDGGYSFQDDDSQGGTIGNPYPLHNQQSLDDIAHNDPNGHEWRTSPPTDDDYAQHEQWARKTHGDQAWHDYNSPRSRGNEASLKHLAALTDGDSDYTGLVSGPNSEHKWPKTKSGMCDYYRALDKTHGTGTDSPLHHDNRCPIHSDHPNHQASKKTAVGETAWNPAGHSEGHRTKADMISPEHLADLDTQRFDRPCAGCGEHLGTEGDFARHFKVPDERYKNLGYCPKNISGPDHTAMRYQAFNTPMQTTRTEPTFEVLAVVHVSAEVGYIIVDEQSGYKVGGPFAARSEAEQAIASGKFRGKNVKIEQAGQEENKERDEHPGGRGQHDEAGGSKPFNDKGHHRSSRLPFV